MIDRCRADGLVDHFDARSPIDVGATGNQHPLRLTLQSAQRFKQIQGAEQVHPVKGFLIGMPDKGQRRQMDDPVRLRLTYGSDDRCLVGEIACQGDIRIGSATTESDYLESPRLERLDQIASRKTRCACDQSDWHAYPLS